MNVWVDLNKMVIPYIYSIYTLSMGMLLNEYDGKSYDLIAFSSILFFIVGKLIHMVNGKVDKVIYGYIVFGLILVFLSIFIPNGSFRAFLSISCYVISIVFMLTALYKIFSIQNMVKVVDKYYSPYINTKTFKPNFIISFFIMVSYILVIYPLILSKVISDNAYLLITLLYAVSFIACIIIYFTLYKYKYAYYVVCSKEKKYIFIENLCNEEEVLKYKWYLTNIEPYINHIGYDNKKKALCFYNSEEISKSDTVNEDNQTLYIAINSIDNLIEKLDNEEIKQTACSIKDELVKIDNYHKGEEYKFNKHIKNINEKYIPYIEKLILSYINNNELPIDITKEMQEKITATLNEIDSVLKEIMKKMYNMNMLALESHMDAMDIILAQSGYKDIKGGK